MLLFGLARLSKIMHLLSTTCCLILLTLGMVQSWSLEDELEGCEVKYEKVGCFRDVSYARALSEEIFNARHNIIWQVGKWRKFLKRLACRCAKESGEKGYSHFGLQFYGECWSDPQAADRFDLYGKSGGCKGFRYKNCDDQDSNECVGTGNMNYVYRIIEDGGGSGIGSGGGSLPR